MTNSATLLKPLDASLLRILEQEAQTRKSQNLLKYYRPYTKQKEFHHQLVRERLLMAGNQLGKTVAGAYEMAFHLTGLYPDWWQGHRFTKAIAAWAGSVSTLATRDTVQRLVCGRPGKLGTGAVPKALITDSKSALGTPDLLDHIKVTHVSGEESTLAFKSYEQGREKWQGETLDLVWFDEEPSQDIYSEGLTRTNATGGITYMTFTPLLGMSEVVRRFLMEKSPGTGVTTMTIDDAEHYTPEQRTAIIASYPAHEREASTRGIPSLGSGRIFPIEESLITIEPFDIPAHWVQICGIDFGWDHPSAATRLAWDRDDDVIYVTSAHRQKEQTPLLFASTVKPWGDWLPWAWPHDGLQHDKGSGEALADQYKAQGLKMLPDKATHAPKDSDKEGTGGNGVEAGVLEMLDRMQTGRWKVFSHLSDWFEEFRMYHRKDGKIVKEMDDLLSSSRYAMMMKRFAITKPAKQRTASNAPRSWMG
jgi:phage terminase large subunit-like protein